MKLWIVGQYKLGAAGGATWDFRGVFDSYEAALASCRTQDYFVVPVGLNEPLPDGHGKWPDLEYPREEP